MMRRLLSILLSLVVVLSACDSDLRQFPAEEWDASLEAPQLPDGVPGTQATVVAFSADGAPLFIRDISLADGEWQWTTGEKPSDMLVKTLTSFMPPQSFKGVLIHVNPAEDGDLLWGSLDISEVDADGKHRFKSMTSRLSQVCVEVDRYAPQSQLAAIYSPSGHFNTFTGTFDHVDAPVAAQLSPVQQAAGGYSTQFAVVPQTFVKGEVVLTYQETEDGETYSYVYKNVEDEVLAIGEVYHIHTAWPVVDKTVYVTDVTLDPETARLPIGDELQLTATVLPENATDKSVTWSSSDESVAKVDANGKVTAVGPGTATITVTTNDGGHTATCTVTVTGDAVNGGVTDGGWNPDEDVTNGTGNPT